MYRIILLATALATLHAEAGGPAPGPGGTPVPSGPVGGGGGAPPSGDAGASGYMPFIMIGGLFAIMYFLMIRPQQKQEKKRQAMIAAIKSGSKVVTIGGLHGEVVAVGEQTVELKVSDGDRDRQAVVMTFNKTAIASNLTLEPAGK